jgi:hypothetical protein
MKGLFLQKHAPFLSHCIYQPDVEKNPGDMKVSSGFSCFGLPLETADKPVWRHAVAIPQEGKIQMRRWYR